MNVTEARMRIARVLLCCAVGATFAGCAAYRPKELTPVDGQDAILTLWGMGSPEERFPKAKEMGVKELHSFSSDPKYLTRLVKEAKKHDIPVYGCVTPFFKGLPKQQMNAEENAFRARIKADKTREKGGYQFGGEPHLPLEVLDININCFHHESVREAVKKRIHDVVMVDGIAGVAFDFFGYDNYRCCRCPHSMKLAKAYHKKHPEMTEQEALDAFSRDSLVNFYNEMADYARALKPGSKVACHVHPVFLPELYYGNRCKLDVCCQTAAWFFEPYWSKERIQERVRSIFGQEKKYWPFAQGAALLGMTATAGSVHVPKTPERIEFELRTMLNAGADRIQVCSGGDLMGSPEHMAVFKRIFAPEGTDTRKQE